MRWLASKSNKKALKVSKSEVYEWSDQPSHSRHMESGSRLSISWNCPWLGRVPRFMLPVGFSNADASAPCGVMVGHIVWMAAY
jgi:hypothetical protein